jgi:adenosylcobyric acid synthase
VPWLSAAAALPAEDSVVLDRLAAPGGGALKIAVPILGRIANFDDLDPLRAEPQVELVLVPPGRQLPEDAGLVVIPGSKSTIADLLQFRKNGWDRDLEGHRRRGGHVVGICGGYQMLGRTVLDPQGAEGGGSRAEGLGLLDVETVMAPQKTVRNVEGRSARWDLPLSGYEIHLGRTSGPDCERPAVFIDGVADGATSTDGKVFGTYLHGLFSADAFRARFLESLGAAGAGIGHRAGIETALDEIAGLLEHHLDVDAIISLAR